MIKVIHSWNGTFKVILDENFVEILIGRKALRILRFTQDRSVDKILEYTLPKIISPDIYFEAGWSIRYYAFLPDPRDLLIVQQEIGYWKKEAKLKIATLYISSIDNTPRVLIKDRFGDIYNLSLTEFRNFVTLYEM